MRAMLAMEGHMNTRFTDLTTMLIDQHLQELRDEAERRRLVVQSHQQHRRHDVPRRRRWWMGGLFLAALTRPVLQTARPRGWTWPHHDGA
jgi:hypothetical protein